MKRQQKKAQKVIKPTNAERKLSTTLIKHFQHNDHQGLILYFAVDGHAQPGEYQHRINNPAQLANYLMAMARQDDAIRVTLSHIYHRMTQNIQANQGKDPDPGLEKRFDKIMGSSESHQKKQIDSILKNMGKGPMKD